MNNHLLREYAVRELEAVKQILDAHAGFEESSVLIKWAIEKANSVECIEGSAGPAEITSRVK